MKKRLPSELLAFFGFLFAYGNAIAAPSPQVFRVEVPQTRYVSATEPEKSADPLLISMGLSSWMPRRFDIPARIVAPSTFKRSDMPGLYANYLLPLAGFRSWTLKAGVGLHALERSGLLAAGRLQSTETQTVTILSLRAGAEFSPPVFAKSPFVPYAGIAALPSVVVAARSSFDEGSTRIGLPYEFNVGMRIPLRPLGSLARPFQLEFSGSLTGGSIAGSSAAGFGLNGGVKVTL